MANVWHVCTWIGIMSTFMTVVWDTACSRIHDITWIIHCFACIIGNVNPECAQYMLINLWTNSYWRKVECSKIPSHVSLFSLALCLCLYLYSQPPPFPRPDLSSLLSLSYRSGPTCFKWSILASRCLAGAARYLDFLVSGRWPATAW